MVAATYAPSERPALLACKEALQREGIRVLGKMKPGYERVLTPEALRFVARLTRSFAARRVELLDRRLEVQERLDAGETLRFRKETEEIRRSEWKAAPLPHDLLDRRVEITGPADRKMIINALNSGANVFMADFEDSNAPTFANVVEGQLHLQDAVDGTITYTAPETGKRYALAAKTATLVVRPRGWHLPERHVLVDGEPVPASLFDFALFFFHNAKKLLARGTGPYFYVPKLESAAEAGLWNDVFAFAERDLGIPPGSIRVTVLVETLPAAFEMDEILFSLRPYAAGLNCGRWDYIFSFIKKLRGRPECLLPDRARVTMDRHFLASYSLLLVKTCHRRGVHAMGGMAAQIPVKDDEEGNQRALDKVAADKRREAANGHDGTWVAHPGLVPLARNVFDVALRGPNQIDRLRDDVAIEAGDLLTIPDGPVTEEGLRRNVSVGIRYLEAWLRGAGCVPLDGLMEDAATAEISRTQIWQWIRHGARLEDGKRVSIELYHQVRRQEMAKVKERIGDAWDAGRFPLAAGLFDRLTTSEDLEEFLTLPAYEHLVDIDEEDGREL